MAGQATFGYDTAGRLSSAAELGRMVSADGAAYAYDALGRLVKQGTQTLAYADRSNNLVQMTAFTGQGLLFNQRVDNSSQWQKTCPRR